MGTEISRRVVLGATAGAVALAAAQPAAAAVRPTSGGASGPVSSAAAAADARPGDPARPVRSEFAPHLDAVYDGSSPWSPHRLRLQAIHDLRTDGDAEHAYRLAFSTDGSARDGIYHLTSPSGASHVLYLGRIGPDPGILEAIVDRTR